MNNTLATTIGLIATLALTGQAAIIATTNFNSVTLSGSTMSDIVWTTSDPNGAEVTANTTATTNASGFKVNGLNPGQFAPDENLHTGTTGSWTGTFTITVSAGFTADLTDITFDFDSLNSGGTVQNATREITYDLTVAGSTYGSQQGGNITSANVLDNSAVFTESLSLGAGSHTIVVTADGSGPGVFSPMDNFSINGSVNAVPEPSSTVLFGLGGLAFILRRRK